MKSKNILIKLFFVFIALLIIKSFYIIDSSTKHLSAQPEPIKKQSPNKLTEEIHPREQGEKAVLPESKWIPQTFNNCGPATTSMLLQHFGFDIDQDQTRASLRTNENDTNVFTYEIADYLKSQYGLKSKLLYGGDLLILKKLISNGFYIMVEDWMHPNEDIGHNLIIRGFDDKNDILITDDSYLGVGNTLSYQQFYENQWKAFNREYFVVYKSENEKLLKAILKEKWDENIMYLEAEKMARNEIAKNKNDTYAWFNLGTSLYALKNYKEAKNAFEKSRSLGWPSKMLWYQIQPIQNYNKLGEYKKALELIKSGLSNNNSFAELHLEAAIAYRGLGDAQKAKEEAQLALIYSPKLTEAKRFLITN